MHCCRLALNRWVFRLAREAVTNHFQNDEGLALAFFQRADDEEHRFLVIRDEHVLERVDPLLASGIELSDEEFHQLVDFVREGLLDAK